MSYVTHGNESCHICESTTQHTFQGSILPVHRGTNYVCAYLLTYILMKISTFMTCVTWICKWYVWLICVAHSWGDMCGTFMMICLKMNVLIFSHTYWCHTYHLHIHVTHIYRNFKVCIFFTNPWNLCCEWVMWHMGMSHVTYVSRPNTSNPSRDKTLGASSHEHIDATRITYSRLQIGWHRISRLFLKLFQPTRILPMGFMISTK